jgi:hypothetical protein
MQQPLHCGNRVRDAILPQEAAPKIAARVAPDRQQVCTMPNHMTASALTAYLCEGGAPVLRQQIASWLGASSRFRTFAEAQRDKIRKKIRMLRDGESERDLLVELGVAYRLLAEKRFSLAYEVFSAAKTRGPDYTVTYTTRFSFTVEVTRLRHSCLFARWADVIAMKLIQMPAGLPNVVVVATSAEQCPDFDLPGMLRDLRALAERKDDTFFAQRGWPTARDFLRQFARLSALVWWDGWDAPQGGRWLLWQNAQARHPLPNEACAGLGD